MTSPLTQDNETPTGRKRRGGWFVTDEELLEILGIPFNHGRRLLHELDSKPTGFPQKDPLFCDRRYLPAVEAYFKARYERKMALSKSGRENV